MAEPVGYEESKQERNVVPNLGSLIGQSGTSELYFRSDKIDWISWSGKRTYNEVLRERNQKMKERKNLAKATELTKISQVVLIMRDSGQRCHEQCDELESVSC